MTTLEDLNENAEAHVALELAKCCVSATWTAKMAMTRPYTSSADLITKAASVWYSQCNAEDYLEAFKGHPKIGDIDSLKDKYALTKDWAGKEQAKITDAPLETLRYLAKANSEYEAKFGYIFIVSASGKSAEEMLAIVQKRLSNSAKEEMGVAMNEQHKITVIRLTKLIEEVAADKWLKSQITTHALDTVKGIPASGMMVSLSAITNKGKKLMSVGSTNLDGRVFDLLPPGRNLEKGEYEIVFDTAAYQTRQGYSSFYPKAAITFLVSDEGHYHIPLLLSPYGYTTYKGS